MLGSTLYVQYYRALAVVAQFALRAGCMLVVVVAQADVLWIPIEPTANFWMGVESHEDDGIHQYEKYAGVHGKVAEAQHVDISCFHGKRAFHSSQSV